MKKLSIIITVVGFFISLIFLVILNITNSVLIGLIGLLLLIIIIVYSILAIMLNKDKNRIIPILCFVYYLTLPFFGYISLTSCKILLISKSESKISVIDVSPVVNIYLNIELPFSTKRLIILDTPTDNSLSIMYEINNIKKTVTIFEFVSVIGNNKIMELE